MKYLIFLAMAAGLVVLWQDDKAKSSKLNDAQAETDSANQQLIVAGQKIQQLQAQLTQMQPRFSQPAYSTGQTGSQISPSSPPRAAPPTWYENELNGKTPSLMDPPSPSPK